MPRYEIFKLEQFLIKKKNEKKLTRQKFIRAWRSSLQSPAASSPRSDSGQSFGKINYNNNNNNNNNNNDCKNNKNCNYNNFKNNNKYDHYFIIII